MRFRNYGRRCYLPKMRNSNQPPMLTTPTQPSTALTHAQAHPPGETLGTENSGKSSYDTCNDYFGICSYSAYLVHTYDGIVLQKNRERRRDIHRFQGLLFVVRKYDCRYIDACRQRIIVA